MAWRLCRRPGGGGMGGPRPYYTVPGTTTSRSSSAITPTARQRRPSSQEFRIAAGSHADREHCRFLPRIGRSISISARKQWRYSGAGVRHARPDRRSASGIRRPMSAAAPVRTARQNSTWFNVPKRTIPAQPRCNTVPRRLEKPLRAQSSLEHCSGAAGLTSSAEDYSSSHRCCAGRRTDVGAF